MDLVRILVLGGYGMIGLPIVRRMIAEGHEVIALGRDAAWGKAQEGRCRWVSGDISTMTSAADWQHHLEGVDVVINASGALQSGLRDRLEDVQHRAIVALCAAADRVPGRLFIQISAPGADPAATTEFLATKGKADAFLRQTGLRWVVLKPALVIAPDAYGGTALVRMLASVPAILPLVYRRSPVATVDVAEVAEAVHLVVAGRISPGQDLDMAAEENLSLEEVVLTFRRWLGFRPPLLVLPLPNWIGALAGKVADGLGHLGWRSPLRSTALNVMSKGVTVDAKPYISATGRHPDGLAATLSRMPATVQERWFARLYLFMPLLIGTLSAFWFASGLIGLLQIEAAARVLPPRLFHAGLAEGLVIAGSLVDIMLGLLVLYRPAARLALAGMVLVTGSYLLAGSLFVPALWLDPLGPFVKTIPAALLALIGMQLLKTR